MQNNLVPAQKKTVASTTSNARKPVLPKSLHPSTNNPVVRDKTNSTANSKPKPDSGGNYEAKLVEMINTSIVDRSPSVKWEDVGKMFIIHLALCLSIFCSLSFSHYAKFDCVTHLIFFFSAGLEKAKQALMEMVILPTKRRDLFTGLRRPARGNALV